MVDFDGIINLNIPAVLSQGGAHSAGIDADGQRPVGGVVHGEVPPPLLEDHLGVDLADAHKGDAPLLHLEGGEGALQPGELALLVGEGVLSLPLLIEQSLGDELDGLVLHILVGLFTFNGYNHALVHAKPRSSSEMKAII